MNEAKANNKKSPWMKGKHHSEESKLKNRLAHLGKTPWNKGIPMSEEQKKKASLSKKGQIAWNKGLKGSIKSNKTTFKKGQIPWNKGQKLDSEKFNNMGMRGKKHSEDSKKRMSLARLGTVPANKGIKISPDRYCKYCGGIIPPKKDRSYNKDYCSRKCSGLARQKRTIIICKNCGKEFEYCEGHNGKRQFCSRGCQNKFGRVKLNCKECGKEFERIKYWKNKQIYCSKTCQTKSETWRAKIREERWNQVFPLIDSKPEQKLQQFCVDLGFEFEKHKHIHIVHRYQADLYLPKLNMVVEADGDYWHGDLKPEQKKKDEIRTKEMIEKGYKVLRLWESDIKKMTKEEFKIKVLEKCKKHKNLQKL